MKCALVTLIIMKFRHRQMQLWGVACALAALAALATAQKPGRFLSLPNAQKCANTYDWSQYLRYARETRDVRYAMILSQNTHFTQMLCGEACPVVKYQPSRRRIFQNPNRESYYVWWL
ncbi:hypothetical protein EVAR_95160_1 [Eumeta japonica]|uniref:Uncharacterized protein n=1 Tax=Eumeta variegata TaxID=151549 RepID=A0A4C1VJZ6_EUMVA|nr:hypothetical protein EVAR_95160_1 [Eumeta japonica]